METAAALALVLNSTSSRVTPDGKKRLGVAACAEATVEAAQMAAVASSGFVVEIFIFSPSLWI